jgi:type II secretory pathway component PulJ
LALSIYHFLKQIIKSNKILQERVDKKENLETGCTVTTGGQEKLT